MRDDPARDDPAARGALAGLDLVRLARAVAKERLGQRRAAPVEHRDLAVDVRPRAEQIAARAAIGSHREEALARGLDRQPAPDLVQRCTPAIGAFAVGGAAIDGVLTVRGALLRAHGWGCRARRAV
jgi:hypothetical protein